MRERERDDQAMALQRNDVYSTKPRGWMDVWTDGRMDGWMDGWMDEWVVRTCGRMDSKKKKILWPMRGPKQELDSSLIAVLFLVSQSRL